jgi:dinuclear metal center YbgI/SA1388 family protein
MEGMVINMSTVEDIFDFLNEIAPLRLAEDYDNPGLLVGDKTSDVSKALLSLDITPITAVEAAECGAQLIISHHPVIFKPVKSVLSSGNTAAVWKLVNLSLSAICMHTNLDTASGGVNDVLAEVLGLNDISPLGLFGSEHYKKISVFVPESHAEKVRLAMAATGAGRLGVYDGCAFETRGAGYFRPLEGAKPFIGEIGCEEHVDEVRVEVICAANNVKKTVAAMLAVHPYEVPAYDIFDDEAVSDDYGIGRMGCLATQMQLKEFAHKVKSALSSACIKVVDSGKPAFKVAFCSGSLDEEFINEATKSGADTLLTGEMKHSLYYVAMEAGLNVVEAGHFATETVVLPRLREKLSAAFPQTVFEIAKSNREPYYAI